MDKLLTAAAGREERRVLWREHVEGQARSGLRVTAYCAAHGLKVWQLSYWRKALQAAPAPVGGFVELGASGSGTLSVECAGCCLTLRRGFDAELLRQVVSVLRAP